LGGEFFQEHKGENMVVSQNLVEECKTKLMEAKEDIINRVREAKGTLVKEDTTGDEGDQTNRILQESEFMANQERLRKQLFEIESALSRIDDGTYGLCEETDEPIEEARLKAIPWTRLSIEGAEIRESQQRKYAR
tara:strand:+ start:46454 stop:46858 length:405 start_codon:yes stop_codon:yes gene_type:complete